MKPFSYPTPELQGQKTARAFLVIQPGQWPAEALRWRSGREKGALFRAWRKALVRDFGTHARVIRLAWELAELCWNRGYAYASDGWIARETGLSLEAVQRALKKLADGGAIVRVHVPNGRTFQRQVFLGASIVERHRTRHGDGGATPVTATVSAPVAATGQKQHKEIERHAKTRTPTVREAARIESDLRAARERGEPRWTFLDDAV